MTSSHVPYSFLNIEIRTRRQGGTGGGDTYMANQATIDRQLASQQRAEELANHYPELVISEQTDGQDRIRETLECTDCDYWEYTGYVSNGCATCGYTFHRMQEPDS